MSRHKIELLAQNMDRIMEVYKASLESSRDPTVICGAVGAVGGLAVAENFKLGVILTMLLIILGVFAGTGAGRVYLRRSA